MSSIEIISLVVTVLCLVSFCLAFTFLFRHYYKSETEKVLMGKEDKALLEDIAIDTRRSEDKKRKILSLVGKIAGYVVLAVVGVFFVMTLISRFSSGALFFGGALLSKIKDISICPAITKTGRSYRDVCSM